MLNRETLGERRRRKDLETIFVQGKRAFETSYNRLSKSGKLTEVLTRMSRGSGMVALADQIMVSASNFATGIVLVRGLGLQEFGKYSVAWMILLYANSLQMSFVALPMLNIAPLMSPKQKRQFVEGMLAVQLLASLLLVGVFVLGGSIARLFTHVLSLPGIFALAANAGTYQLQDWLRRYYFIYHKRTLAIICDFISYVVQLMVLVVLWRTGGLTFSRAFMVMAFTSLVAFAMGPITDRLWPAIGHLRETWAICRRLSRDLLIATQVRWIGGQGVYLVGTLIVGTAAAGGIRAASNLSGPIYLALSSLDNFVPIRVAEELKRSGTGAAYDFIQFAMLRGTIGFIVLIVPVALFGRSILRLLYGPALVAFYGPMLLQMVNLVLQASAILWFHLYRGLQDTRALIRGSAVCAIASMASVYWLGHYWRASGIVLSSLIGQSALVLYSILYWKRHSHELMMRFPRQQTPERPEVAPALKSPNRSDSSRTRQAI